MHRLPKHEPIKVFEGFAGYGGATFGLRRAKINHEVIGFSEIDNDAIELFNFSTYFSFPSFFKIYESLGIETLIIEYGIATKVDTT